MNLASTSGIAYFAEWRMLLQREAVLVAFGRPGVVGIFFGLYRACKARLVSPRG